MTPTIDVAPRPTAAVHGSGRSEAGRGSADRSADRSAEFSAAFASAAAEASDSAERTRNTVNADRAEKSAAGRQGSDDSADGQGRPTGYDEAVVAESADDAALPGSDDQGDPADTADSDSGDPSELAQEFTLVWALTPQHSADPPTPGGRSGVRSDAAHLAGPVPAMTGDPADTKGSADTSTAATGSSAIGSGAATIGAATAATAATAAASTDSAAAELATATAADTAGEPTPDRHTGEGAGRTGAGPAGTLREGIAAGQRSDAAGMTSTPASADHRAAPPVSAAAGLAAQATATANPTGDAADGISTLSTGAATSSDASSAAALASSPTTHLAGTAATSATTAPVAAAPSTPPSPVPLMQPDIAGTLARLRGEADGTYQLRVSVHPAELGGVDLTATVRHGALTVVLTPDQAAHRAVTDALPQLRQHLLDSGFAGVDVGVGSGAHGQHADDARPEAAAGRATSGATAADERTGGTDADAQIPGMTSYPSSSTTALDRWL